MLFLLKIQAAILALCLNKTIYSKLHNSVVNHFENMETPKRNKRHDIFGNSNNMSPKLNPYQYAINLFKFCVGFI